MQLIRHNNLKYILVIILSVIFFKIYAQDNDNDEDIVPTRSGFELVPEDSVRVVSDSIDIHNVIVSDSLTVSNDSISSDSIAPAKNKSGIEDIVTYHASDSLVFLGNNNAYLYGDAQVNYQNIELKAAEIAMNLDSSTVFATGVPDSSGVVMGKPVFTDSGVDYNTTTINYNFKTQKAFIDNLITQQGEGYVVGGKTKKMEGDEFYMVNGK